MSRFARLTGLIDLDGSIDNPELLEAAVLRRMFRFGALALTVVTGIFLADHALEHHPKALIADCGLLAIVALCAIYAKRTKQARRALDLMHTGFFVILLYHAYLQGLVNTAAYWWLSVLPFAAITTGAFHLGIAQFLVFAAVGVSAAQASLGGFYAREPHEHNYAHVALGSILATAYAFFFVLLAFRWRQQLQRALAEARAAAIEAAEAKARFLANVSHEIRTPLSAVIGAAELLRTGPVSDAQRAQLLALQSQSANALLALVNDVLDWSKIDVGKLVLESRPLYLRSLVFESNELFAVPAFDKGIELTSSCDQNVPRTVLGDATRILQIVNNLVSNAVKFTSRGGVHLHLSVGQKAAGRPLRQEMRIEVADTGIGIEPQKLDSLFSAFVQGDETVTRKFGGSGLGLAISQELARLMGGRIEVTSALGKGSTFTLIVPMEIIGDCPPAPKEGPSRHDVILASSSPGLLRHVTSLLRELQVDPTVLPQLPSDEQLCGCHLLLVDAPLLNGITVRALIDQHSPNERRIVVITPLTRDAVVGSLPGAMLLYKPVRRSSLRALLSASEGRHPEPAEPVLSGKGAVALRAGLRVLVAEDNPVNQVIVQAMLAEIGTTSHVVDNGRDALDLLKHEDFDLVLMDVQMPVMDGVTAVVELRAWEMAVGRRRVPVVAMTASPEAGDGQTYRAAGMDDLLGKPFGMPQLRRLLAMYGMKAVAS